MKYKYTFEEGLTKARTNTKYYIAAGLATLAAALAIAVPGLVHAADGYTLFGEASLVSPGKDSETAVQTVSDDDPAYGGIEFDIPTGTTFADIETLSTDFMITEGDCGAGSPRFQIRVPETGPVDSDPTGDNIFVYIGDYPNYNNCDVDTWVNTGDLLENALYVDTSQLGGTFYDTYENAVNTYGTLEVSEVSLVTDGGNQTILFDNVNIDGTIYDFESEEPELTYPTTKDECKKGGWQTFTGATFKNQGDCVSYVATGGRNMPAGEAAAATRF